MSIARGCSAVLSAGFALCPSTSQAGSLTTLYSFESNFTSLALSDGSSPIAGLSTLGTISGPGTITLFGSTATGGNHGYGLGYNIGGVNESSIGAYIQSCNLAKDRGWGPVMGDFAPLATSTGTLLYGATSHLPDPNSGNDQGPTEYGDIISCNVSAGGSPTLLATFNTLTLGSIGGLPSGALVLEYSGAGPTLTYLLGTTRIGGVGDTNLSAGSNTATTTSYIDTGGTIYAYAPPGTITVVHSFGVAPVSGPPGTQTDGVEPVGGLVSNGNTTTFYGTTAAGGLYGFGTIFQCTPAGNVCNSLAGSYSILYNFHGATDGMSPTAPLNYGSANTYGTTSNSGSFGGGTIFRLSSSGSFTTLHSFPAAGSGLVSSTGANPAGDIVVRSGDIRGTTWQGGDSTPGSYGGGTIYEIDTSDNSLTNEYSFSVTAASVYGLHPFGGLTLGPAGLSYVYGTTHGGGCATGTTGNNGSVCPAAIGVPGSGTVFTWTFP